MPTAQVRDDDRYRQISKILHDVSKPMRVLAALNWPAALRTQFLESEAARLPWGSTRRPHSR